MGILSLNCCSSAKMSFALCCMLFGILVVFPETDGDQLTWNEPLPVLTVQESDVSMVIHRNHTRLIEGTINASLSWYFSLSSGLTLVGVNLKLKTDNIAFVNNQKQEVSAGFKDKYAINWIPNQRITVIIFKVTSEHNATFACEVVASGNAISIWRSHVQVDVVGPPSNIITSSDQTITAPAELTLNCLADGKPTPTIFWTRVSDNTNVSMPLNIIGGKNEESYQCTADNGVGNPLTKVVKITVLFPPSNIFASDQTVTAPRELTLNCLADGKPTPTIFWTRVSDNTNVSMPLNITGGKNEESYRCTADNGIGNPLTKVVKISILFPPKVILAQKVFVGREETASLNCEVKGNPPPTISWSPCDEGNPFCNNQCLNISQVQSARANYVCTARNHVGRASGTTVLLIGGKNIYSRLRVLSGECDKNVSVWETLVKELPRVFLSTTHNYSGAELLRVWCGSLIFDVIFKFSTAVAEDETFSIIQNAAANGKLGELSVNVSYIIGIPRFPRTTSTAPTSITSKSDDQSSSNLIVTGVFIGVGVLISVVVGLVILWVLMRRNSRKENTKGDYEMAPKQRTEEYEISPGRLVKIEDALESSISRPTYVNLQEVTQHSKMNSDPPHNEYAPLDLRTRSWEVAREDVIVEKVIGKGAFGQVAKGTAKNLSFRSGTGSVAIKMIKANAPESDKRDLKSELELMKTLKPHPHVIKLLGCVTESEPLLVLIEYVPYGDLLGYLRKSRGLNDTYYKDPDIKPKSNLTSQQLMKFAWQIADGMSYLSLRKVIHRDLAARNVLVGEREICKITDFGMARDVQDENIYERKTKGRLPVKWTAYEALLYGQYTTKSDVWSYGVVLYEVFTIGGSPYPRMDGRKVIDFLQEGHRMQKPEHVDNKLYEIMRDCWQSEPETRPSFADLTQQLKRMEDQHKRLLNMHIYDNAMYANLEDLNA
ncbi:PREDICTED: fibroblast growth factor receptor 3-like isoform X2 [Acropora digitifera]|uniref:fibroblast growth factor receptor 3-like isoform X2 n=1 Tax=Acropora digitifera TaxID=70779 RepID=UPI00077A561B|nr:PREDICTED: fibroblast growth factor receptor 3-like isoform X2 [Acropora digitifera]